MLVFTDIFTGWVEGLPTRTEAVEVAKTLLVEIIPRFGLPTIFRATVDSHLQQKFPTSFYRLPLSFILETSVLRKNLTV